MLSVYIIAGIIGGVLIVLSAIGGIGDHDADLELDHDVDLDVDHDIDLDVDHDVDLDADHAIEAAHGGPLDAVAILGEQLGERVQQFRRQVVDDEPAGVLEGPHGLALAGTAHSRDDREFHVCSLSTPRARE